MYNETQAVAQAEKAMYNLQAELLLASQDKILCPFHKIKNIRDLAERVEHDLGTVLLKDKTVIIMSKLYNEWDKIAQEILRLAKIVKCNCRCPK